MDGGYESWLGAMGTSVEALGASDAKHGARLRLENHAFLQLALQVGRRVVRSVHSLQPAHERCSTPARLARSVQRQQGNPCGERPAGACASADCSWAAHLHRHAATPPQSLPLDRSPALRSFAAQAAAQLDRALGAYVEQQVEQLKLARVLEFSRVRGVSQDAGALRSDQRRTGARP